MPQYDVIISAGTVVDGTGAPPRTADVAIADGRIVEVGVIEGSAARVVDADGAVVTPGFVDIHTHYDGQATWDSSLAPSSWHGVTTVVMGNCGVGFAPVHPHDHQRLIELMEGVEDIPGAALHEGLSWEWQSFPEYLDAVERVPHDIDVGAQVPHGAVRLHVMGERGANRESATAEEIAAMGAIAREAIEAGALGFSTSRTLNHRTSRGEPTPTLTASEDELVGIAAAVGESGMGVFEVVSDFLEFETEFTTLRRMVEASGRPLSISLVQSRRREDWRSLLGAIEAAAADGLPIKGQVGARPIGVVLGVEASLNPFMRYAGWAELAPLDTAQRVALLRDPLFRERLLAEDAALAPAAEHIFDIGDPPDYEPPPEASIAAEAARRGVRPEELVYDLLLQDEGRHLLYYPIFNYVDGNLDALRHMLTSEHTVAGLGDGGAHVGTICDGSYPTTMLTHWARDRVRGERLELPLVVRRQTRDTARAVGLGDRGVLAPGMRADINVIDFEGLRLRPPEMHFDLPAGGKRLLQRADGYLHTFVAGVETYADGVHTGALPGQLVRGARSA